MVCGMGGCSIALYFFACISLIIAAYRFSVSWILRLRVSAFLLQLAVTVLYILVSSVKEPTILSTASSRYHGVRGFRLLRLHHKDSLRKRVVLERYPQSSDIKNITGK